MAHEKISFYLFLSRRFYPSTLLAFDRLESDKFIDTHFNLPINIDLL